MSGFVVRLAGSKEIVGLFVAESIDRLRWAVDEVCDPHECEYVRIGSGGIYWSVSGKPVITETEEEIHVETADAELSESVWARFAYQDDFKWKGFA